MTSNYLTRQEVAQVIAVAGPRERALILILYRYGLRISEALGLRWIDVSKTHIQIVRKKGSQSGRIKMFPDVWEAIVAFRGSMGTKYRGEWLFGGSGPRPITSRGAQRAIKSVCLSAGIDLGRSHPHIFKHSIATHLAQAGAPTTAIASWLGHKSIASTLRYVQKDDRVGVAQIFDLLNSNNL